MSAAAKGWITLVVLGGCLELGRAIQQSTQLETQRELSQPLFWLLLISAGVAHAYPVVAPRHQAYHATQALLMAAVLLLSWPSIALIVLAAHLTEWLRRPRPIYIQLYNVAVYLLSVGAAGAVLDLLHARPFDAADARTFGLALTAAAVVLLVNHGLTAIVLRLARGVTIRQSRLFGRDSLSVDGALLLVGVAIAVGWQLQPLSIVVTGAPLLLIYRALRLANIESASHRDSLTGLYNGRHFLEALQLELHRGYSTAQPTGILVAVVDDVPLLVQRFGRATLDFLLMALGERLQAALRDFDVIARLDEGEGESALGVLLPGIDGAALEAVAERLDRAAAAYPFVLPTTREPVAASLSLATASVPPREVAAADVVSSMRQAAARAALAGPRAIVPAVLPQPEATLPSPPEPSRPTPTVARLSEPPLLHRGWLLVFQAGVSGLGVAASVFILGTSPLPDVPLAAGVLALVALSELLAFDLFDQSSFSVSFVPVLAAGLLGGPAACLLATWSVALLRGGLRRSVWNRVVFNGSVFSLLGVLATELARLGGTIEIATGQLPVLVITVAAASIAYYLHTFLVAGAIALDLGADPRQVWSRNYRWLFPHYILLGWMALGLALATIALGPLGSALFLAPPLAMRFVLKQYVERTTGAVHRLELANAELRAASALVERRSEELALLSDLGQLVVAEPRSANLPALVGARCVPALGDLCAVVWESAQGLERSVHADAAAETLVARVGTEQLDALELLPKGIVEGTLPDWAAKIGGTWLSAPLAGVDHSLGSLLSWSRRALSDEERTRRLALMREVAQRLALVLERDALLEEAAEVEALRVVDRAKSDFIATTAHELRTPLTSLQGYTELLRSSVEPALRERWLGIVQLEAAQLGQVVDQLLDVSRLESGRFNAERRRFDLAPVVERVVEHFGQQAALSGHVLHVELNEIPPVYADPAQIERVLRNLLSNALKYSPAGGEVRIVAVERAHAEVEVCVEDQGLGIPADWLGRLFERFQRVERRERDAIRGVGLGLYIARQLIDLNAGRIWASSAGVGRGASFHFTLPCAVQLAHEGD